MTPMADDRALVRRVSVIDQGWRLPIGEDGVIRQVRALYLSFEKGEGRSQSEVETRPAPLAGAVDADRPQRPRAHVR